jgi:glycine C-acetyltransferase
MPKDLFDKISNLGPIGSHGGDGYYMFPRLEGEIGPRMTFMGKEKIVWSLNNYLGLANHPEVRATDAQAAKDWGFAYPMGARMMSGESKHHRALEQDLASFVHKPAGLLLNFGYQGILSVIDSLLGRRDVVVYDKDCHACIMDAIRMHRGDRFAFEHNDIESFEKQIVKAVAKADEAGGGVLVITEGVFGMRGEMGIIREIAELKSKYGFRLLVDDAHGFGTIGPTGAGAGEEQGVQDDIDVYFSTFAKSMALIGAFVAGSAELMKYFRYNLRSQIFAKSLPMPLVIGAIKRLELLKTQPQLREKLWENVTKLQHGLSQRGFNIGETNTCVTPVMMMHSEFNETLAMIRDLRDNYHIFTSIVVYPVIPKGMVLLRLIPTAVHTDQDIAETLEAFTAVRDKLESGAYVGAVADMSTI